jgi:hypothetical protein
MYGAISRQVFVGHGKAVRVPFSCSCRQRQALLIIETGHRAAAVGELRR